MKVKITKDVKKWLTLEQAPIARRVIECAKEEMSAAEYAEYAAAAIFGYSAEILKADAEIARNSRVWEWYGEGTQNFDVWINATAYSDYLREFAIFGVYVSDINSLTGDNEEEIVSHMYVRRFKEISF